MDKSNSNGSNIMKQIGAKQVRVCGLCKVVSNVYIVYAVDAHFCQILSNFRYPG